MDGNRKPSALTVFIRIPHQLDEHKGQKQGCQKIKGAVLVASHEEIGTGFLPQQFQVDLIPCRDLFDQFRLEYLQAAPQPDDNAAPHRIGCLLEQAVRGFCRVVDGQDFKQAVQRCFGIEGNELVNLAHVPVLRRVALIHIQHQCF